MTNIIGRIRAVLPLIFLLLLVNVNVRGQNELDILKDNWLEFTDASNSLYHHLTGQAYILLKQRADKIAGINSLSDWQKRQQEIRKTLSEIVGPFPEKTPLNARIVRTIDKESYRIEHIIYESQPGFFVTSSLFIPAGINRRAKAPVVIYCSGHSADGYRNTVYQHVILNLVKKGFIVFAFDPVGQGERLEYYDMETGKSAAGSPTKEHSYPGAQAFLTGSSQAMYMIWDGIRAVDYLLTRKEVDPLRIGITGRSGGGTQSAYIAAFDDRIYAAAPENYLTNYTRLLQSIGPQDAEQNLFNIVFHGLDHPDFLEVRAPRPALMITTTRDMFSIQGAVETEKEVCRIYKAYGKEENFSRIEDDAGHESTLRNRERLYAFFQKQLDNPGNSSDEEIQPLISDELQVTKTGQISTTQSSETVFSLNSKTALNLETNLDNFRKDAVSFAPRVLGAARILSGYIEPLIIGEPVFAGRIRREGFAIEKYFIKGEGNYVIPYLLFIPEKQGKSALIYLHPGGKSAESLLGGNIERIVKEGITVLVPDLPGIGELGQGALQGDANFNGVSHNLWYASMLIKRSITGLQAGEIVRLVRVLRQNNKDFQISGLAVKELSPALLHAAAFAPEISKVILLEPYSSWMSLAMNRFYNPVLVNSAVPGALKEYDLPDIEAGLAPRRLLIAGTTDGNSVRKDTLRINRDIEIVRSGYNHFNAGEKFNSMSEISIEVIIKFLAD